MKQHIQLDLQLSEKQAEVFAEPARFKAIVAGRRFGKTFLALAWLFIGACQRKESDNWYVAPTYRQAHDIAWEDLKRMVPREMLTRDPHEGALRVDLYNGSSIQLRGASDPDKLRGPGIHRVVLDEFAKMKAQAWYEVLRPMISDKYHNGDAMFIGTPAGYNHFYDVFMEGKSKADWASFHFTTLEGGNVTEEEIDSAMHDMGERQFRQEYLASFENLAGRVYYAYDREQNVKDIAVLPDTDLLVGMDFNVNPMTAVIGQAVVDQLHVFDEVHLENSNTTEMMQEIRRRYPTRSIVVYPDPSGRQRHSAQPRGMTDISIIKSFNCSVYMPDGGGYVVEDRINTVNALLKNAAGERRCFFDRKLKYVTKAMDGLTYKEGSSVPDFGSPHIHISDAIGYLIMGRFPMIRRYTHSQEFRM